MIHDVEGTRFLGGATVWDIEPDRVHAEREGEAMTVRGQRLILDDARTEGYVKPIGYKVDVLVGRDQLNVHFRVGSQEFSQPNRESVRRHP